MTKADLISKVAETGMTKKEAAAAIDAAIKDALGKGESPVSGLWHIFCQAKESQERTRSKNRKGIENPSQKSACVLSGQRSQRRCLKYIYGGSIHRQW
jgi:hypothetical protein